MLLNTEFASVNFTPALSSSIEESDRLTCFNQPLLETIPDAVYLYDLVDQRNVFSTRSIANLLGYDEEMQDIGLADLIHPDDLEAVADHFQRFTVLPSERVLEIVYRMKRADGQWCWLRSRETSFIQAIDGYPLQILGMVQDITNTMPSQQFWKAVSIERQRNQPMMMMTDREGRIEYANQKFEQVTGYTRADIVGKTPSMLKSGQHQPNFYRHLWNTIESGQIFRGAFINRKKTGELFHEDKIIVPLKNGEGEITHFFALGEDVMEYWQT